MKINFDVMKATNDFVFYVTVNFIDKSLIRQFDTSSFLLHFSQMMSTLIHYFQGISFIV